MAPQTDPIGAAGLPENEATTEKPNSSEVSSQKPPYPRIYLQMISAGFSFFVAGVSDGSLGALIPYLLHQYNISTSIVSVIYGASFFGWFVAALINTHLSQYLDLGAMLSLGAVLQILGSALRTWAPPFGLFAATFWVISLGQALQDTHANTFVASSRVAAHRWLGFIHAMYMAGCLVGPFVSTSIASASTPSRWNLFYVVPVGLGVLNLALVGGAFRDTLVIKRRAAQPASDPSRSDAEQGSRSTSAVKLINATLRIPGVWLLSLFFFFYLGVAITAGGWVVEYLVVVRKGDLAHMGYVPAGYSGGCFLGRLLLPEITHRWGERRMVFIYCVLCLGFQLCFWLVSNIIVASVTITLLGFFSGPFFATAMSLGTKLFPSELHPTALAFVFVFAQIGGSLFPIIAGVLASHVGVAVLQPILVGLITATGISWLLVPQPKEAGSPSLHQE